MSSTRFQPWRRAPKPIAGNAVELLRDGEYAFPAMLEAISAARELVLLEFYWFATDGVGSRFLDALHAALARGVTVIVVYDDFGSGSADRERFAELRAAGAGVHEYNPISPWRRRYGAPNLVRRDHRKLLVVDDRIAFTGGINLGDEWAPEAWGGGAWRDDMVRVEGPAAQALGDLVRDVWRRSSGVRAPRLATPGPVGDVLVQVLGQNSLRHNNAIYRAYLAAIGRAERRVWLRNSYFVPTNRTCRALEAAARRGVDVRVLVPGVSDVWLAKYASRAVYGRLLRAGVRVFEWPDRVLHAKTALVDDDWSTIGTFNLDHLSLRLNLEVNVGIVSESFAARLAHDFELDFAPAVEIDAHAHAFRSLGQRLLDLLFRVLSRFVLARAERIGHLPSARR